MGYSVSAETHSYKHTQIDWIPFFSFVPLSELSVTGAKFKLHFLLALENMH